MKKIKLKKKNVNGIEIEYSDVIYLTTTTKFCLWDRIKILLGKEVRIHSEIYTQHDDAKIVGSESKTYVSRLIPAKSKGGLYLTNKP